MNKKKNRKNRPTLQKKNIEISINHKLIEINVSYFKYYCSWVKCVNSKFNIYINKIPTSFNGDGQNMQSILLYVFVCTILKLKLKEFCVKRSRRK